MYKKRFFSAIFSLIIVLSCFFFTGCDDSNDGKIDLETTKVAVIYFSATNNTKAVAEYINVSLKAESTLIPIKPMVDYTGDDLDYNDKTSRVYKEHENRDNEESQYFRPEILDKDLDFSDYDIIFLGYPIWWGEAPNIIYTFLETYSAKFANKTIIPFCTSSSSKMGDSAKNLHSLVASSVKWFNGTRFASDVSQKTVKNWVEDLSL